MARKGFEPFLMDRLIDEGGPGGAVREVSLEEIKASVARELEALLNARQGVSEQVLAGFPQARNSVLSFGMVDFSSMSLLSEPDRNAIRASVEETIRRHERRLRQARVVVEWNGKASEGLRLVIHAQLVVNPVSEPVNFNAVLEPKSMQYSVKSARAAA
jgi:type VI secretion system protein ImpF